MPVPALPVSLDGLIVKQPLPGPGLESIDPILLLHHMTLPIEAGSKALHQGVGPHPHRGFEPVTFVLQGSLHHRDSRGNSDVIHAGGVQWMTSGKGIIHSERPSAELAEAGGTLEIIQVWINLPKASKLTQPRYQGVQADAIPTWSSADGRAVASVIAGRFGGLTGPVETHSEIGAVVLRMRAGANMELEWPVGHRGLAYVAKGEVTIDGEEVPFAWMEELSGFAGTVPIAAIRDSTVLVLSGVPLNEPVVKSGPYVMTDQTEILEAMRDYRVGKMGFLVEE